jgi:hypothetical protein
MPEHDEALARALDELLPRDGSSRPEWAAVLRDAQKGWQGLLFAPRSPRLRLAVLAAGAAVVLLLPLTAVAVGRQWWFFSSGLAPPTPVGDVIAVRSGGSWVLGAYRTNDGRLCVGFAPSASGTASSAVLSCGTGVRGLPNADATHELSFVESTQDGSELIGGPTADDVARVEIVRAAGPPLVVDAVPAPASLGLPLRFFAAVLDPGDTPRAIRALDATGGTLEERAVPGS